MRRARIHFGSVEGMKDDCRQACGLRVVDDIARDVKHAGRFLRRNPGFGLVAVATLGLSIGATVLVFSRRMALPASARLRSPTVSPSAPTRPGNGRPNRAVLYRDYLRWKET